MAQQASSESEARVPSRCQTLPVVRHYPAPVELQQGPVRRSDVANLQEDAHDHRECGRGAPPVVEQPDLQALEARLDAMPPAGSGAGAQEARRRMEAREAPRRPAIQMGSIPGAPRTDAIQIGEIMPTVSQPARPRTVERPQSRPQAVMQDPRGAGVAGGIHRQTRGRGVSRALSRY